MHSGRRPSHRFTSCSNLTPTDSLAERTGGCIQGFTPLVVAFLAGEMSITCDRMARLGSLASVPVSSGVELATAVAFLEWSGIASTSLSPPAPKFSLPTSRSRKHCVQSSGCCGASISPSVTQLEPTGRHGGKVEPGRQAFGRRRGRG